MILCWVALHDHYLKVCQILHRLSQKYCQVFLTAHTPFPPPTPKKRQQTFVLHTQKNSASFVLHTQKRGKKGCKKCGKKGGKKSLLLNLSCYCLETGLVISESLLDLAFLESRSIMTRPITLHSKAKLRT